MRVDRLGYLPEAADRPSRRPQPRRSTGSSSTRPARPAPAARRAHTATTSRRASAYSDRLHVVHRRRQGLQAARRQARERAVRHRPRRVQKAQVRRARVLLPAAQRHRHRDAVRRLEVYERPAGHVSDKSVPCSPEAKCNYKLDVSGGWYDAGDQGKYLVNGGFSVWALQNQYECDPLRRDAGDLGDGKMSMPEGGNGKPDLLDEARWGLDLLLRMQVPDGQPNAGMAHHKMHDASGRPSRRGPHRTTSSSASCARRQHRGDAEPGRRRRAGARLWRSWTPRSSARCLTAAETAYAAAKDNPNARARNRRSRRRHLRRRRRQRRVVLGRRRAVHHDRQARIQRRSDQVRAGTRPRTAARRPPASWAGITWRRPPS